MAFAKLRVADMRIYRLLTNGADILSEAVRVVAKENAMRIALRHTGNGNFKFVETGWSWPIFWYAGFFGLPLFFRGLSMWGTVMVAVWALQLAATVTAENAERAFTSHWVLGLISLGLCIFLGFKGNGLSAQHFIACGYDFVDPESAEARYALDEWNL